MAKLFNSCTAVVVVIYALIFPMSSSSLATVDASGDHLGWMPSGTSEEGIEELQMDTEIGGRILATTSYISYGALQRDTVPCSRRGSSYYNCQSSSQANPYNPGCSAITRCRS